ncbi:MAG: transporter substrate-binding domain-containing protein [Colwellia sp.]|nr:transporter substrate-binding domain-containing protein [Colwellia sp.]MCW8865770.1 transporter substrate-binding domain-containing protein [Colwellia sp.]MCW9081717.1 transporter substrate-binding domain-containing protein [Colwellia sp.]
MPSKFKWLYLLFFLAASPFIAAKEKINVDVYVYHLKPPFIVSNTNKLGLYYDFSDYLNAKSENYHFETIFVPRKRIETMLVSGNFNGILLGVNPVWFDDKAETQFLWTNNVYQDQDEVVSLPESAIEYTTPRSLSGKILGGVRGFYYFGIDELVKKGDISRHDTIGEYELLQMLMFKRVDVGIVSRSTLMYLSKAKNWQNKFYLSKKPHDKYQRRVLVPHQNRAVYEEISPIIDNLAYDPVWQEILVKY